MKKYFILLQLLLASQLPYAQSETALCGTTIDEATHQYLSERLSKLDPNRQRLLAQQIDRVAITAHVVRRSDGTGGLLESQLIEALEKVNEHYINAGMEFFFFGDINYVDSDSFYDFDAVQEDGLASSRDVENTINIYFVNSLTSDGSTLCGYAYFPGNEDRILMDNSCTMNGTTLSHEIGHFLTLYHTHGRTNNGTTDELVDGSNCDFAGDEVCDTAADPNLSGKIDAECRYTSNEKDANGETFKPDPENIMSYSRQTCRRHFSTGQYQRAYDGFITFRNYLYRNEYIVKFKPNNGLGCVTDGIQFENQSFGKYVSVSWEFEGGTPSTSQEPNPVVTYNTPGVYGATLTLTGEDGSTDAMTISNAVSIVEHGSVESDGFLEDFEGQNATSIFSPADSYSLAISDIGYQSDHSMSIEFFNYQDAGREDFLLFEPLVHPQSMDYILSFDYAFTYQVKNGLEQIDNVSVLANSCGNWTELLALNGKEDATTEPKSVPFSPTESEWRHIETYLPAPEGANLIQVALRADNSNGNNFYIDNVQVSYADDIVIRDLAVTNELCSGDLSGKIAVDASFNGAEMSYSLDNQSFQSFGIFENVTSGNYTVFVSGGDKSKELDVKVVALSQAPAKPLIIFSNDELKLLTTEAEVEWYYNDELVEDSGVNSIPYQGDGTYYVIVRNFSGCENVSDPFVILGTDRDLNRINIYPNPVNHLLNIDADVQGMNITINDLAGKQWMKIEGLKNQKIDVAHLPEGIYLVSLRHESTIRTFRMIKR